jgi:hypothetical protein
MSLRENNVRLKRLILCGCESAHGPSPACLLSCDSSEEMLFNIALWARSDDPCPSFHRFSCLERGLEEGNPQRKFQLRTSRFNMSLVSASRFTLTFPLNFVKEVLVRPHIFRKLTSPSASVPLDRHFTMVLRSPRNLLAVHAFTWPNCVQAELSSCD